MDFNLDSSDEPVIYFNTNNVTFETPLTIESRNSIEHEKKYDITIEGPPRPTGEVIPEVAIYRGRGARVSYFE